MPGWWEPGTRSPTGEADVVFLAAETPAALEQIASLRDQIARDGAIWVIRPKGRDDLTEGMVIGGRPRRRHARHQDRAHLGHAHRDEVRDPGGAAVAGSRPIQLNANSHSGGSPPLAGRLPVL